MSNSKIYNVIGIMSGTSMDGVDISLIRTDGRKNIKIIYEKSYEYSDVYRSKLKKLIKNLPNTKNQQFLYCKKNDEFITKSFIRYIEKFINEIKPKMVDIHLIGLSGQTITHNPDKGYSIQLGSGKKIYQKLKIPIVVNFRENDLKNGGQGAPIGSFYHKYLLSKFNKKSCIINLGGIANITFANKIKLISYDMGMANSLIDDLCFYFFKKKFDRNGTYAEKGKIIEDIFSLYKQNSYFKKNFPKSLDRYHFNFILKKLKKNKPKDAIHTASMMTVYSIIEGIKLIKEKINTVILTGGGRKNLFIKKELKKKFKLSNTRITNIENFGFNGDMIEAQMFGFLAVRSIKKLPLSNPTTTGVKISISGGVCYGNLIKN